MMAIFSQQHRQQWGWLIGVALTGLLIGLGPLGILPAGLALLPGFHPAIALACLILSVTAQDTIRVLDGVSLTQLAAPLAVVSWLVWWGRQNRWFSSDASVARRPYRLTGTAMAWAAFLTIMLVSASLSQYSTIDGLKELWRWGIAGLAWLIAATTLEKRWQFGLVLACLLLGPLINALLGLNQFATGSGPVAFRIAADTPFVRAYGTIGQPNSFAGYLNMAWPLALALAIWASTRCLRQMRFWLFSLALLLWVITLLLLAALAASFSRGAWLGAAAGLLAIFMLLGPRRRWLGLAALLGVAAVLTLGGNGFLPAAVAQRIASLTRVFSFFDPGQVTVTAENFAVVERMAQLWAGWQMALQHPLFGVGPGAYSSAYQWFAVPPWFASRGHAHNAYLHLAAELGVAGLLAYAALVGCVARDGWYAWQQRPQLRMVVIGICGMIVTVSVHQVFEYLHVLHMSIQIAAAWGLLAALRTPTE